MDTDIHRKIAYTQENINLLNYQLKELDRQLSQAETIPIGYVITEADIQDIRARQDVKREQINQYYNTLSDLKVLYNFI
jgi:hypothetical protein